VWTLNPLVAAMSPIDSSSGSTSIAMRAGYET
jgi:hypothetical protein